MAAQEPGQVNLREALPERGPQVFQIGEVSFQLKRYSEKDFSVKSIGHFPEEVQTDQGVRCTMPYAEHFSRFDGVWYSDSEAAFYGFVVGPEWLETTRKILKEVNEP
jgi:hypothetical protein